MMNEQYLRGYLDGLCELLDSGVYYNDEDGTWVCDEGQKKISIGRDSGLVSVEYDGTKSFDIRNIIEVFYNDGIVSFKISEVI